MRLFAAATARGPARGSDANHARPHTAQPRASSPPSPSAQRSTKPKLLSLRKGPKRKKNTVHPIDKAHLQAELERLSLRVEPKLLPTNDEKRDKPAAGFTATISIRHTLDLHNPCLVRSCPHSLMPVVQLSVNDSRVDSFRAAHNAKNHSSWSKTACTKYQFGPRDAARVQVLRVDVLACCSRQPGKSTLVDVGSADDIALSPYQPGEVSRFCPLFRYQTIQNRVVKYFAGKVKLVITITVDEPETCTDVDSTNTSEQPNLAPVSSLLRPSLLPPNFGHALQLQRKQLKATILPEVVAVTKITINQGEKHKLMEALQVRLLHHMIQPQDVRILDVIGEGIHANVLRVRVDNIDGGNADVAMKEYRYNEEDDSLPPLAVLHAFHQEYEMLSLSTSYKDNTRAARLLGAVLRPRLAIFTDYCSNGSLARCLADHQARSQLSFPTRLRLAHQIATGLACLHDQHIVHRDIKPHNILVDGLDTRPLAKIGDFGSAVVKTPTDPPLHEETGSSGYTAPEVFCPCGYDCCADIWSLGVVLWELFTLNADMDDVQRRNPFAGACGDQVVQLAENGERPVIPASMLPPWCECLLRRCWNLDPSLRPTAAAIASEIANAILLGSEQQQVGSM